MADANKKTMADWFNNTSKADYPGTGAFINPYLGMGDFEVTTVNLPNGLTFHTFNNGTLYNCWFDGVATATINIGDYVVNFNQFPEIQRYQGQPIYFLGVSQGSEGLVVYVLMVEPNGIILNEGGGDIPVGNGLNSSIMLILQEPSTE